MNKKWQLTVLITATILAAVMQGPFLLRFFNPNYQGVYIHLNSDEEIYLARVQEGLTGNIDQVSEAFVGEPGLIGSQFALIETVYGLIFRGVFSQSATLLTVMDSVMPVLIFFTVIAFLLIAGFTKWQAYAGSLTLIVSQLYNLNRPIHLRASFLLTMLALLALSFTIQKKKRWGSVIGGALLGILVGVYVWSWTFAWLWIGIYLLWELLEWMKIHKSPRRLGLITLAVIIGVLAATPFVAQTLQVMQHPLSEVAVFRSGMRPGRLPESLAYSLLFTTMVIGLFIALRKHYKKLSSNRPAVVTVFAAFGIMHQQAVHGTVFNFVSHSIFSLALAAIIVVLLAWKLRSKILFLPALAAIIYLSAITYDGRWLLKQWDVRAEAFDEQHLAPLLEDLRTRTRTRILSDRSTSATISEHTQQDVLFSHYLKNVLLTHEENAERLCLQYLPIPPQERNIENTRHLVYADAIDAFPDPKIREEEVNLVLDTCTRIDANPQLFLEKYGVDLVVWDEKSQPTFDLKRLKVPLELAEKGEGWSVWQVK